MATITINSPHREEHSTTSSVHHATPGSTPDAEHRPEDLPLPSIESGNQEVPLENEGPVSFPTLAEVAAAIDEAAVEDPTQRTPSPVDEPNTSLTPAREHRRGRRSTSRQPGPPHHVEDEEPPEDLFNSRSFQAAFQEAKGAMKNLANVLGSSSQQEDTGATILELKLNAVRLAEFQHPATRTVGFVGASGSGKSSLLNSLLDAKNLGRASNSGQACTCVATEYHYRASYGFTIEADLWTEDELMNQLSDLLQSYRQFHSRSYDENSEAARQDCENRAKMAEDTFQAMFCDRLGDGAFLVENTQEDVLQTFQTWVNDTQHARLLNRLELGTLEECSSALMQLTSDKTVNDEPPLWPYLRKIKVYCNARILSKGLILADLPGLGDLNSARRNVTERFLRECHEIFVVCNIGRAVTDVGVEDVFKLAVQAKQEDLRNVGIVCTRSDDIKPDEARNDWTGPTVERIRQLQREVEIKKRELLRIKQQFEDLGSEDEMNSEDIFRHMDQRKLAKIAVKQSEFELREFLITTRNDDVIEKLTALYEEFIPENNLQVYCVSNPLYWEKRDVDREESQPYLNLSGILQLRKRCISIVSNAQHEAATSFMQNDIPALIANIGLWVESGAATMDDERKESIRRVCGVVEQRLVGAFQSGSAPALRLSRSLQQQFTDNIWSTQNTTQWVDCAREMASLWHGWHHATYAAYCRNFGHYCLGVKGGHNWNEEIIQHMVDDLSTPWESVHDSAMGEHDNLSSSVHELLDGLIEYLETELGVAANEVVLLRRVLQTERSILLNAISQAFRDFERNLFQLRVNTLSGIRTSFVGIAMERSYRACQNEGGTGSDRRRKAIIEGAATNRQLFTGIMRESRAEFIILAEALHILTVVSMDDYVTKVGRSLNIIRDQNVASESGRDPAFRRRVEEAVGIAQDIMSDVEARIRA